MHSTIEVVPSSLSLTSKRASQESRQDIRETPVPTGAAAASSSAQGLCSAEALAVSPVRQPKSGAETALSTSLLPITSAVTRLSSRYRLFCETANAIVRSSRVLPESRTRARTRLNILSRSPYLLLRSLAVRCNLPCYGLVQRLACPASLAHLKLHIRRKSDQF